MPTIQGGAVRFCDGICRRSPLRLARSAWPVGRGPGPATSEQSEPGARSRRAGATCNWSGGGPSHIDTYALKTEYPEVGARADRVRVGPCAWASNRLGSRRRGELTLVGEDRDRPWSDADQSSERCGCRRLGRIGQPRVPSHGPGSAGPRCTAAWPRRCAGRTSPACSPYAR